ncbi:hypothetical protein ACJX0J_029046, partial [Zea mays]
VSPIEFGTLPVLQDAVTVVGYPIGGDTISVTSGVVSRIEILSYVHAFQINSGGPAFNDRGKCVGIAFQSLKHEDAENIGYVIPTPVITHFIEDYKKSGEYTGWDKSGCSFPQDKYYDSRNFGGANKREHTDCMSYYQGVLCLPLTGFGHLLPQKIYELAVHVTVLTTRPRTGGCGLASAAPFATRSVAEAPTRAVQEVLHALLGVQLNLGFSYHIGNIEVGYDKTTEGRSLKRCRSLKPLAT